MTAQLIDFAATLNTRRAGAEIAKREETKAARIEAERREIADALGGTAGAHIIADVVTDLKAKEDAASIKYVPAYCDPTNDVRGSKYDATRGLYGADLAARIRQDIKDAIKAGMLPAGLKVSTKTHSYAGGYSIDCRITALPAGFKVMSEPGASWRKQFGDKSFPGAWRDAQSDELRDLLAKLGAIHGAYNRDNSDSMVDYFDRRYYGSAELDWQVRRDHEAREVEASAGTYWHESMRDH